MIFTLLSLHFLEASFDAQIESSVSHPLCNIGLKRVADWTERNNAAFKGAQDQLVTVWDTRQKYGTSLTRSFKVFLDMLEQNQDWATGKSPWHKMKYMPSILATADSARWPDCTEFERKYPRLGIDFLGKPEATDLKAAIGLILGDRTPEIFYHNLRLPSNAPQLPDGPWKRADQVVSYWHNGYSFGGRRLEGELGARLDNGPEDCSSFIAKLLDLNPDNYNTTTIKDRLAKEEKEIKITTPERDLKPGQIIFYPGHIALVFGWTGNGVLVLEYNRDREEKRMEGFGFRVIPIQAGTTENTWTLTEKTDKAVQFFSP